MGQASSSRGIVVGLIVFVAICILSILPAQRWQRGFLQAEYRFTFLNSNKEPVKGVQLSVYDSRGMRSSYFPVTDCLGDDLESDENGVLTFHHVKSNGVEISGECHRLLFIFPLGKCHPPKYTCEFKLNSKTVLSIDYSELNDFANKQITLNRADTRTVQGKSFNWPEDSALDTFDQRIRFNKNNDIKFFVVKKTVYIQ